MVNGADGFDWDDGNRGKCQKHGVGIEAIEGLFRQGRMMVQPDLANSTAETRFRGIGRMPDGRSVFVVFTWRDRNGQKLIRPISARHMHQKEIAHFEKQNP
jgi:uncharacterized protein